MWYVVKRGTRTPVDRHGHKFATTAILALEQFVALLQQAFPKISTSDFDVELLGDGEVRCGAMQQSALSFCLLDKNPGRVDMRAITARGEDAGLPREMEQGA